MAVYGHQTVSHSMTMSRCKNSTRNTIVALVLSDRRTCVCHRRPPGDRLFLVSAHRPACPAPAISRPDARSRRHRQISTGAWRRGPAGRTHRPIDPRRHAVSRFGRGPGRRPASASSGDCLYTANNARSAGGLTSAGLDRRTV